MKLDESLKALVDIADKEDREVRERQIRVWRKLKLYWDSFQRIWFSEVAHNWSDQIPEEYSSYYDKPINIFRAYLESIIAALSINIPAIKCYPDDADNSLDLSTARAGEKISQLVYRHNNAVLLWIHALFIYCTEGLVAGYNYTKESEEYGTFEENQYDIIEEKIRVSRCPDCNTELVDGNYCPSCMSETESSVETEETIQNERLVGVNSKPKSRQCIEVFGGLFVKVPIYAKKQEDCPYLIFAYETHYSNARAMYPDLPIREGNPSTGNEYYERWGRNSNQYAGIEPTTVVTVRNVWIRPSFYYTLKIEDAKELKKEFPDGVKVVMINDLFAEAVDEKLDDHWTLTHNPLSDYLHHQPLGTLLTNVQDITNDILALILQTIEHGIPQTFADPAVLDFEKYRQSENAPGQIFPAKGRSGRGLNESFYEVRTATLSQEIGPFIQRIQEFGQMVSGALPSLFGGQSNAQGSRTASEYAMSRSQALQRLQTPWKMLTIWWKDIFGKVIPAYIKDVMYDDRLVEKDEFGNFINVFIRRAELQGKIGRIELEGSEQLPMTASQQKDVLMELMGTQHPLIMESLTSPENVNMLTNIFGLTDFTLPGQNDIEKQQEEISQLIQSAPIDETTPSVQVDPDLDNHQLESETLRRWLVSPPGRQAKTDNPEGYQNALLHLKHHMMQMQMNQTAPQQPQEPRPIRGNIENGQTNEQQLINQLPIQ